MLHVYYRRFILTANITTLCIFIWTLYRGLHHGMTSFVFILVSGIITVLLALPPAAGKVMEVGDVEEGTKKLMKFNDSIFAKVRQTLLVNRCARPLFRMQLARSIFCTNWRGL